MITMDAVVDEHGYVHLLDAIVLPVARRALVTVLDEPPIQRQQAALRSEAAKQARDILVQHARSNTTITYSALVGKIHAMRFAPNDPTFHCLIGDISRDEHNAGRPLISVLVVSIKSKRPSYGFFGMASELGFDTSDKSGFWLAEQQRVFDHWKNNPDSTQDAEIAALKQEILDLRRRLQAYEAK